MNGSRLDELLRDDPPALASELREYLSRPQEERDLYLYREVLTLKQSKGFRERLYDLGSVGALLAYVLFDQRARWPGP